ncbi:hypothetical protein BaRGS_00007164 [Batillaria attramentaria]|uniref:Sperm-associated antigen 8 n=1 Tax=Batillaria attramentaria TaxID=370345 RepID=A0ABD0LRF6_9CAEN
MSVLNDGRNEIPVGNSDGKCLLENWVEERSVDHLDPKVDLEKGITSKMQVLRFGHKGLLTTDFDAKAEDKTNVRISYTPPQVDKTRKVGSKAELMERMFFEQIAKDLKIDEDPGPEPTDFRSVKMVDYDFEFESKPKIATRDHNYRTEQPVTFWTEHKDKITCVTQVKTRDTAFRRNDAFTKPNIEYYNRDETQPYSLENYPKM